MLVINDHAASCVCGLCREVRARSVEPTQEDRELFAAEWSRWVSDIDGEVNKLRAGQNGNVGSPRWVALQAIARSRMGANLGAGAICA